MTDSGALPRFSNGAEPWHFLQTDTWGQFKSEFGWSALRLMIPWGVDHSVDTLALVRRIAGRQSLVYIPYGPGIGNGPVPGWSADPWRDLKRASADIAAAVSQSLGCQPMCVRFDLPQARTAPDAGTSGLLPAPVEVQPPSTVIIDLEKSEDDLLGQMHKKNRYNIRLAQRKGVTVRKGDIDDLGSWYTIYQQTAARDGIVIHSYDYYRRFLEVSLTRGTPAVTLYLAEHEGSLLSGIITVKYGLGSTYLYGASSDEKRNLMPNYALQWQAMMDAKAEGCQWYDMFGIPPAEDPRHPMHGLYRFKTGFGGAMVHRAGAWDAPIRPAIYRGYRMAEKVRYVYFHRKR